MPFKLNFDPKSGRYRGFSVNDTGFFPSWDSHSDNPFQMLIRVVIFAKRTTSSMYHTALNGVIGSAFVLMNLAVWLVGGYESVRFFTWIFHLPPLPEVWNWTIGAIAGGMLIPFALTWGTIYLLGVGISWLWNFAFH